MINTTTPSAAVRQPYLQILNNGTPIGGCIKADIANNSHFHADTFTAEFSLTASNPISWWEFQTQNTLIVDVQIGFATNGSPSWQSIFQGEVDKVDIDLGRTVVEVSGRDLSSRLIETRTQEAFINQTSSQVATTLAGRHGLTADVDPTTTLIDRYYDDQHDHITHDQFSRTTTEWDLLIFLAQREGYAVWVSGTTLHFKQQPSINSDPWVIQYTPPIIGYGLSSAGATANVSTLKLSRSLTLAKDILVKVRSWSSQAGRGYTKTAKGINAKPLAANSSQTYVYTFPDLTEAQAQARANQILTDLSKHERVIEWSEPGDLRLTPQTILQVTGTGSGWDQRYFVDTITRTIAFDGVFEMTCRGKNSSPLSEAQTA